ncbi:hypothetical protein MPER_02203, partial [Moniliophthora perniciosa FA553]
MLGYTRILLIGLVLVQTSLALNCHCTDGKQKPHNAGTTKGCRALRADYGLTTADAHVIHKGDTAICQFADWVQNPTTRFFGADWKTWWTDAVCVKQQNAAGGE